MLLSVRAIDPQDRLFYFAKMKEKKYIGAADLVC
jgi:hypothetical protein